MPRLTHVARWCRTFSFALTESVALDLRVSLTLGGQEFVAQVAFVKQLAVLEIALLGRPARGPDERGFRLFRFQSAERGHAAAAGRPSRCPVPVPRGTRTRGLRLLAPCAFRLALRQGLGRRSAVPHTTYHILLPQEEVRGRGPRQTRVSERCTGQATPARPAPSAWRRREVRVLGTCLVQLQHFFNMSLSVPFWASITASCAALSAAPSDAFARRAVSWLRRSTSACK